MKTWLAGAALLALLLATPSPARADKLSEARELMGRDCHFSAAQKLQEHLAKRKDDAGAWATLARCWLKLSRLDDAESAAYNALDLEEKNADYWLLMGEVAFEKGFDAYVSGQAANVIKSWFAEAEAKFNQVLARKADHPDVRWWLGWAKQLQEYPKKAEEYFVEQIEKFPEVPEGHLRLGSLIFSQSGQEMTEEAKKLRRQAVAVFDKGLETAGPQAEILYQRGLVLEWLGEKDKARDSYIRAIEADPSSHKAWTDAYRLKVPDEKLLSLAQAALEKDRTQATAGLWCVFILKKQGKLLEALKVGLPALEEHFEHSGLHSELLGAGLQLLRRDAAAAVEAFVKIHEYYPFAGSAANNLGLYHRDNTRNFQKSVEWYLKASEREPENQDILNDTALIYLFHLKGQEKKALPIYLRTVALVTESGQTPARGFWDACENLAKYHWEVERDPEKVIQYAKLRLNPYNGVPPYAPSEWADHYRQLAEKELEK